LFILVTADVSRRPSIPVYEVNTTAKKKLVEYDDYGDGVYNSEGYSGQKKYPSLPYEESRPNFPSNHPLEYQENPYIPEFDHHHQQEPEIYIERGPPLHPIAIPIDYTNHGIYTPVIIEEPQTKPKIVYPTNREYSPNHDWSRSPIPRMVDNSQLAVHAERNMDNNVRFRDASASYLPEREFVPYRSSESVSRGSPTGSRDDDVDDLDGSFVPFNRRDRERDHEFRGRPRVRYSSNVPSQI